MEADVLLFTNPATGERFGEVEIATPEKVRQAIDEMRQAFPLWSAKPVKERIHILRKFQTLLIDSQDEITNRISQDCGKSRQDALIELFMTVDMLAQYCKNAEQWLKRQRVSPGLYLFKQCHVEYRPHGVVAVIAPWNYPLTLSVPPMLAALLAGNTVILKPSEVTAATGVLIEKLFQRIPELASCVRIVHGDAQVGAALIQAKPDYIFFTGSTPTGRKVLQAAADNLIPVACELGGKDAMIVLEDADLRAAARWGAWGAFFNAGQTCMAVERVYVVESVYDEFVRLAGTYAREFKMGYTSELESPYCIGSVTDPRQVSIIERHLDDALAKGARLLTGGKERGMFYNPMVLVNVDHSMILMREETFGPLMPIMKVKDQAEAIRLTNDNAFGLGASIWSRDLKRAKRVADQIQAGAVIINDSIAQFAVPMLPFGGIKESGSGRIHGREGLIQFTRPYSYVLGESPMKWDIATILREPGHYKLASTIMGLVFGTTMRQRWEAVARHTWRSKKLSGDPLPQTEKLASSE
jgi:acyl-CoA reductase-like NAD-dependent aldehyde dehydrogenase